MQVFVFDACKVAKKNIIISWDINFRSKLWTYDESRTVMSKLMPYVNVCMANEEDVEKVFGIKAKNTDVSSGTLNHRGYMEVAKKISN